MKSRRRVNSTVGRIFGILMKSIVINLLLVSAVFAGSVAPSATSDVLEFSSRGLSVNGKHLTLPCTQAQIESAFGPPTEVVPAHGDDLSDTVIEWSNIGAYAYMRPKTGVVHGIGISLSAKTPERHFSHSFAGTIKIAGKPLLMTVAGFRSTGFHRSSKYSDWERQLGSYYILVVTEPEAPEELEFGIRLNDR